MYPIMIVIIIIMCFDFLKESELSKKSTRHHIKTEKNCATTDIFMCSMMVDEILLNGTSYKYNVQQRGDKNEGTKGENE